MSVINIIAKFQDQTKAGVQSTKRNLGSLEKTNKKAETSFQDVTRTIGVMVGAAAAAGIAINKAMEFSEAGAALNRLEESSGLLASSMGADMDEIVIALQGASKDMVAESDLMASASRALMLGVGKNAEDMSKLMEVAAVRGRAMGLSTQQAFDDIVTGIGRESRMILDNLGIVLDMEKAHQNYAKTVGKSVDDLDDFERKQAIVNAVIEDTAGYLEETGGVIVDQMGQIEQYDAAWKDFMDNRKKDAADFASGVKGWLYPMLDSMNEGHDTMTAYEEAIRAVGDAMDTGEWHLFGDLIRDQNTEFGWLIQHVIDLKDQFGDGVFKGSPTQAVIDYYVELHNANGEMEDLSGNLDTVTPKMKALAGVVDMAQDSFDKLGVDMEENTVLTDLLALKTGDLTFEELAMRDATDRATEAYNDGLLTMPEYIAALEDIAEGANEVMTAGGLAAGAVWTLSEALGSLPREKRVDILVETYYTQTGSSPIYTPPNYGGGGGGVGPGEGGPQALGGFYDTNRPTVFRTSEYGQSETAIFIPQGKSIYDVATPAQVDKVVPSGKGGNTYNYNLTMPTSANPADIAIAFELLRAYGEI